MSILAAMTNWTRIVNEANEFVIILSLKPLLHFMDTLRGSSGLVLANKII